MIELMKKLYTKIWVPFFGRILNYFAPLIEGKKIQEKPTYKMDND